MKEDSFVIESYRDKVRAGLVIASFVIFIAVLAWVRIPWLRWTGLILAGAAVLFLSYTVQYVFTPDTVEKRICKKTFFQQRLYDGMMETRPDGARRTAHGGTVDLSLYPHYRRGFLVRRFQKDELRKPTYTEGRLFGAICIETRGCPRRTAPLLWLHYIKNRRSVILIHVNKDDAGVAGYLRMLDEYCSADGD